MQQARLRSKRMVGSKCVEIFDPRSDFVIKTKFTTILASGPNGAKAWPWLLRSVPREDNTIMAVNFAVTYGWHFKIDYLIPDIWCVTDKKCASQIVPPETTPWFGRALALFKGKKAFNVSVVQESWDKYKDPGPFYMFKSKRLMMKDEVKPHSDVIRPGGSVTTSGAQIWYHFCKHPQPILLLCGADMSGDAYVVGSNTTHKHGDVWNSVNVLGKMCQYLIKHKGQVYTISPTKLLDYKYIEYYPGVELNGNSISNHGI